VVEKATYLAFHDKISGLLHRLRRFVAVCDYEMNSCVEQIVVDIGVHWSVESRVRLVSSDWFIDLAFFFGFMSCLSPDYDLQFNARRYCRYFVPYRSIEMSFTSAVPTSLIGSLTWSLHPLLNFCTFMVVSLYYLR